MMYQELDPHDCHFNLRNDILRNIQCTNSICVSLAWDWQFNGITKDGVDKISRSVHTAMLENRKSCTQSLAVHETALLRLAKHLITYVSNPPLTTECEMLAGILPTLRNIIKYNATALGNLETLGAVQNEEAREIG